MRTKITDSRRATRVDTVVFDDDVEGVGTTDAEHIDTRMVFIRLEDGDASDWERTRTPRSRLVIDTWRPQWVAANWSKRSDQDSWHRQPIKVRSLNIKKDGKVGEREENTYIWHDRSGVGAVKLPPDVVRFIEEHAPGAFPFSLDREDAERVVQTQGTSR